MSTPLSGHASEIARTNTSQLRPYPSSWVDRLGDWVRALPIPSWSFYLILGLALMLVLLPVAFLGGGVYVLEALTFAYMLGLMHHLDDSAAAALQRYRPVLAVDDTGYNSLCRQLTTLPAQPTWVACAIGAIYGLASLLLNTFADLSKLSTTASMTGIGPHDYPIMAEVADVSMRVLLYSLVGALIYHTFHQLRVVNFIYTKHTRINLFQLGPLYALSGLTAQSAMGIAIPAYLWFQVTTLSALHTYLSEIIQAVFLGSVILVTFIWPLLGAHRLLEKEKQRLEEDIARRIEATMSRLHGQIDADDLSARGPLKETLDGLVTEQGVVEKLRTWPWRTGTVRGIGVAFVVPIFIWVVQRVLERLGL